MADRPLRPREGGPGDARQPPVPAACRGPWHLRIRIAPLVAGTAVPVRMTDHGLAGMCHRSVPPGAPAGARVLPSGLTATETTACLPGSGKAATGLLAGMSHR